MIKIYIRDISELNNDSQSFKSLVLLMPKYRQDKINAFTNDRGAKLSLLAGLMIKEALIDLELPPNLDNEILITKDGYEYLPCDDVFFSISHSGTKVMVVFSDKPIGCDIQYIVNDEKKIDIARKYFDESEYRKIINSKNPIDEFYKYWTIKESYVKAIGRGLSYGLNKILINGNKLSDSDFRFKSYKCNKDYRASYVVLKTPPIVKDHNPTIHVVGEALVDIIKDENGEKVNPGGAPLNVAHNIAKLGGIVNFYASVGEDKYGQLLNKISKNCKFNCGNINVLKGKSTTQALVTLTNCDRSFKFVRKDKTDCLLSLQEFKKFSIKENDIVHIGSLMLSETKGRKFFFDACELAHDVGARVSFDVNYREGIFKNVETAKNVLITAVRTADIIKLSKEELFLLADSQDIEDSLHKLINKRQIAFVTDGANGSLVFYNNEIVKVPSIPVVPIDTTGAGDAFFAYVLTFLDKYFSMKSLLKSANAYAGLSTQEYGGFCSIDDIDIINNEIKKYYFD